LVVPELMFDVAVRQAIVKTIQFSLYEYIFHCMNIFFTV
jgi:hypothetical protein